MLRKQIYKYFNDGEPETMKENLVVVILCYL